MSMPLGTRRKSCHRRNDSNELDVFKAEGYLGHNNGTTLMHALGMMAIRDDCNSSSNRKQEWREGRVSLDIPAMSHHYHQHHHHHHHYYRQHSVSQPQEKEKKHKQPSSPGGKLASFFSSLIVSKKKKCPKPKDSNNASEQHDSPSSWRWRRSINSTKTRNTNPTSEIKVESFSALFGFRSSPSYSINTPKKSYKDLSSLSGSRSKNVATKDSQATKVRSDCGNLDWLDEKFKCIGVFSDQKSFDRKRCSLDKERRRSSCADKRFKEEEDGGESDSSSDLFELQLNFDRCSSGLPVYETTSMDSIKRSSATPIANI